jgi:2-oxoglutarate dehydrogenase E2 component (dihydrolipoamide succinyltransferase)
LETDKVSLEVTAEADGVLQMIAQPTGSVVGLGDVLGSIGEGMAEGQAGVTIGASATASVTATAGTLAPALTTASVQAAPGGVDDETSATPLARRVAEERRIDLGSVQGSGARGRITREDVERLAGDGQRADVSGAAPAGGVAPAQPVPPVAALAASAVAVSAALSGPAPAAVVAMGREERVRMRRPDDRPAAGRGAAHGGDPDNVQRG